MRLRGEVEEVTLAESDAYFASRPRNSRIGAWASQQSQPMENRFALEKAVAVYAAKFGLGEVPRPPHWIGYRIKPVYIEFWTDKPFRLPVQWINRPHLDFRGVAGTIASGRIARGDPIVVAGSGRNATMMSRASATMSSRAAAPPSNARK